MTCCPCRPPASCSPVSAGESVEALPAEAEARSRGDGAGRARGGARRGGGRPWAAPRGRRWSSSSNAARDIPRPPLRQHVQSDAGRRRRAGATADAEAYRSLAVYPQDTTVPSRSGRPLLDAPLGSLARADTTSGCRRSPSASCSRSRARRSRFHDLQRDFLLLQAEDLSLLHAELLAAYRTLLPHEAASWAELPQEEPYIWEHLLYHLRGAGDGAAITALVCDLAYLALRSFRSGPYAAESDLRQAADAVPRSPRDRLAAAPLYAVGPPVRRPADGRRPRRHARKPHTNAPVSLNSDRLAALLPACFLAPQWGLPAPHRRSPASSRATPAG